MSDENKIEYTQGKLQYSPCIQLIIFILAVILFIIYKYKFFKNKKYNKICLLFSIVLLFWMFTLFCRYVYKFKEYDARMFYTPDCINTFVGEKTGHLNGITIWTVGHFVFYTIVGVLVPGLYIEVLAISIFYEIFEQITGHKPQYIIDPVINMAGYIFGSSLSIYK
jgi:hypothetical protein